MSAKYKRPKRASQYEWRRRFRIMTITRAVLEMGQEYGISFILKCVPSEDRRKVEVILQRDLYPPVTCLIQVDHAEEGYSPEDGALGSLYCNLEPIKHPIGFFPLPMTETLATLLSSDMESVYKLAEITNMPDSKPIPRGKLEKYDGSLARLVLDFYQYLCLEKKIEKKDGLQTLRNSLETLNLQKAAECVRRYELEENRNIQGISKNEYDKPSDHKNMPSEISDSSGQKRFDKGRRESDGKPIQPDSAYHSQRLSFVDDSDAL